MKKQIAILASGGKERSEALISRLNPGERVEVSLIITDRENSPVLELDGVQGTQVLFFDRPAWKESEEIAQLLHDRRVELLVTDDFRPVLPEEIAESFAHRIIDLGDSDPEGAISLVMKRLLADRANPDRAWAEALGVTAMPPQYTPESTPPPVPQPDVTEEVYVSIPPAMPKPEGEPMPPTYLIWSIICTLLCCFIPGLFAIFFSSQVSSKYYVGDIEGARRASKRAEIWIIVSFVLGVISATLYFPLMMIRSMI